MCTLAFGINAVNYNRACDAAVCPHGPETVSALIVTLEKFRKLDCNLSFKEETKSPVIMLVGTMQFGNPSQRARNITLGYLDL